MIRSYMSSSYQPYGSAPESARPVLKLCSPNRSEPSLCGLSMFSDLTKTSNPANHPKKTPTALTVDRLNFRVFITANIPSCPACRYDYAVRGSRVVSVSGELTQMGKLPEPYSVIEKKRWYRGLKHIQISRGHKPGGLSLRGIKASSKKCCLGLSENCRSSADV